MHDIVDRDVMDDVIREVLLEGLVDWTDPGWIVACMDGCGCSNPPEKERKEALQIIDRILKEELVVAGDVSDDGFVSWKMSPGEASARIRRDWTDEWVPGGPTPGAIGWFQNTDKGDEIIKTLLREEEERKKNARGNGLEA